MAHEPQTFDRTAQENNGEWVEVAIPAELAEYLEITPGDKLRFQKEDGEHGKYASFWKVEETLDGEQEASAQDGTQG